MADKTDKYEKCECCGKRKASVYHRAGFEESLCDQCTGELILAAKATEPGQ